MVLIWKAAKILKKSLESESKNKGLEKEPGESEPISPNREGHKATLGEKLLPWTRRTSER